MISRLTNEVRDPGLGTVSPNTGKTQIKLGVCQVAVPLTLLSAGSLNPIAKQAGSGPLGDAVAQVVDVAGGPCLFVALPPSTYGTVTGAFALTGTGPGTVTGSIGPEQVVKAKIVTAGVLGVMAFKVAVGTGSYGQTITSVASGPPYTYQVPGQMFTTLAFAAGTYVINDVYTLNLDGTVTRTGTGTATFLDGSTNSPTDNFEVWVLVTSSGALGAATFRYSLDGGNNYSTDILIPAGGKFAIPGSGVVLTFASTFAINDLYVGASSGPAVSNSDVTAAFTYLLTQPNTWGIAHLAFTPSSAANAATLAAVVDVQAQAYEQSKRYIRVIIECPQSESDSVIAAAFAGFTSAQGRVSVVVGDVRLKSRYTSRWQRRNGAWAYAARLSATKLCSHPGQVKTTDGGGFLKNVQSIYRDEESTPALDAARFVTLRQLSELPGGYFITDGMTMAPAGSDYQWIYNGRVVDRARQVANAVIIQSLNADLRADDQSHIAEPDAQEIESDVRSSLRISLLDEQEVSLPPTCAVDRTVNFVSTNEVDIEIGLTPRPKGKLIKVTYSLTNPALQAGN